MASRSSGPPCILMYSKAPAKMTTEAARVVSWPTRRDYARRRAVTNTFGQGVAPFHRTPCFGVGFVPELTALQVGRGSDDALSHLSLPRRGNRRGGTLGPNLESHLSQIRGRISAQSLSNRSK